MPNYERIPKFESPKPSVYRILFVIRYSDFFRRLEFVIRHFQSLKALVARSTMFHPLVWCNGTDRANGSAVPAKIQLLPGKEHSRPSTAARGRCPEIFVQTL